MESGKGTFDFPFYFPLFTFYFLTFQHRHVCAAAKLSRPCANQRAAAIVGQAQARRFAGLPDFVVCRLRCRGEPLVEIRREPQIVRREQSEHGFVQASGRKNARQLGRGAESLTDHRDPGVDGGRRRLGRRHAAHFVQHQHPIDDRGQAAGDAIPAWRRLDQPEIQGGFDVRKRNDLPRKDGEHSVDDLSAGADAERAESKEPRATRHDECSPHFLPAALFPLPCQRQFHQNACPSEMCSAVGRSRSPVGSTWRSSLKPRSTRIGPTGER